LFVSEYQSEEPKFGYLLRQRGFSSNPEEEIAPNGANVRLGYRSSSQHIFFLAVTEYASASLISVVIRVLYVNLEVRKPFRKDLTFSGVAEGSLLWFSSANCVGSGWRRSVLGVGALVPPCPAGDGGRNRCVSNSNLQPRLTFSSSSVFYCFLNNVSLLLNITTL